jgi:hypothetical protein
MTGGLLPGGFSCESVVVFSGFGDACRFDQFISPDCFH